MDKMNFNDHKKENYMKTIIVLFVMVILLMLLAHLLSMLHSAQTVDIDMPVEEMTELRQVIEFHGSKYIKEDYSPEVGFSVDVYLVFKVKPYEDDDTSNEEYYTALINDCARVLSYRSFIMYDEENQLTVKVKCQNNAVKTITINDIDDYFIYMDSEISMRKWEEIPTKRLFTSSPLLQSIVDNDWTTANINFGSKESIFENYYIYHEEGYKVRSISGKVYNIVFNSKYTEPIVGSVTVGMSTSEIMKALAEVPTYEDEEMKIIGYKTEDYYIFFTKDEISVYRMYKHDEDEFFELASQYIYGQVDFKDFMNKLTTLWPDYSTYDYTSNSVSLKYPLKGIEISLNVGDKDGILVYNNIRSSMAKIEQYFNDTSFVARLQIDSVFKAEKERIANDIKLSQDCRAYYDSLTPEAKELLGRSLTYNYLPCFDNNRQIYEVKFVSVSDDAVNRQLTDGMYTFKWISNDEFAYSKTGKGIYLFNLTTGHVSRLIEGTDDYQINGYSNGILTYDNGKELPVQY